MTMENKITTFVINYVLPHEREAVAVYEANSFYTAANGGRESGAVRASRLITHIRDNGGEYKLRKYITTATK